MIEVTAYRADRVSPDPVASFFTLNGAGFGEPPRHTFTQRCEAAAATGFAGIGLHIEDLARTREAGTNPGEMRAALRSSGLKLVEIEFRRIRCGARSPRGGGRRRCARRPARPPCN